MTARVIGDLGGGRFGLEFHHSGDFDQQLEALGELPLPHYITRARHMAEFDRDDISPSTPLIQAPSRRPPRDLSYPRVVRGTASKGNRRALLTLYVGPGTFQPYGTAYRKTTKWKGAYTVPVETAARINRTKPDGHRIVAVGPLVPEHWSGLRAELER